MSEKRFLQLSFLLPIVLPLLVLLFTDGKFGYGETFGILTLSLTLGGIPYLLFLACLFLWMRDKNAKKIQRMTFFAPILFVPVFLLCVLLFAPIQLIITGNIDISGGIVFICCVFIIILGYSYVLFVNGAYLLFKAFKALAKKSG